MKKLLFLAAAITLLSACKKEATPSLSTEKKVYDVPGVGTDNLDISVSSNVSWKVTGATGDDTTWLRYTPTTGNNNGRIFVTVKANTELTSRSAELTLRDVNGQLTPVVIKIQQAGAGPVIIRLKTTGTEIYSLPVTDILGFQMFLDAKHNTYGAGSAFAIDTDKPMKLLPFSLPGQSERYAKFKYKIPSDINASDKFVSAVHNTTKEITIPAGTYDFAIVYVDTWLGAKTVFLESTTIASGSKGMYNDYVFEPFKTYTFEVTGTSPDRGNTMNTTVKLTVTDSPR